MKNGCLRAVIIVLVLFGTTQFHWTAQAAAPSITQQPADTKVLQGNPATFGVEVSGDPPLFYQWFRAGGPIANATNSSYTLSPTAASDSGVQFSVIVSNTFSSVTSAVAVLRIDPGQPGPTVATSLVSIASQTWRYNQSGLDLGTSWRVPGYDDSTWASGQALFGLETTPDEYLPYTFRTAWSLGSPQVITYYLRTHFTLGSGVSNIYSITLSSSNLIDDGAVFFINGAEAGRVRVASGQNFSTLADNQAVEGVPDVLSLDASAVVPGDNVLAVEVHQTAATSSDVVFGMVNLDAVITGRVPDTTAPIVTRLDPPASSIVSDLTSIEVLFSEPVDGVDPADLLINGVAATNIVFGTPGQFTFEFAQPPTGVVNVAWANNHGIVDRGLVPNSFAGGSWTYTFDPNSAPSTFIINEFLASNNKGLRDEDGDDPDWIEILNPGKSPGNLQGWYLTDDPFNLTKWQFPYRVLDPSAYLLVFASGKNRTNIMIGTIFTNLHANFTLGVNGGFLALVDPNTNVVSSFGVSYPPQSANVSYGRDRLDPSLVGYFSTPTPRTANSTSGAGIAPAVSFSKDSGTFIITSPFNLVLSTPSSNAVIFYAFGTNLPGSNVLSTIYTNGFPIPVTNTLAVRARAFEPGKLPGPVTTKFYFALANQTNVINFSSGLPVMILHNYGQGTVPSSKTDQYVFLEVFDNDLGYASMTNIPTLTARGDFHVRGSSTAVASTSKAAFFLEVRDEVDDARSVSMMGLPQESDWVLYAPNNFEPALFHNPLAHDLYRDTGHYGSRTRFFEMYLKDDSGAPGSIGSTEYQGIYVLEEKIKRDKNRIDITPLDVEDVNYPAVTGGYVMSIDRTGAGEATIAASVGTINYVSPNGFAFNNAARAPQATYIRNYLNQFNTDLQGPNWTNTTTTNFYGNYINIDQWVNFHIHEVVTFNVDGFRLSGYFYKDRLKPLEYGPTWDYDRTQGSTDGRDFNPRIWRSPVSDFGTDFFNFTPWWARLLSAPDFWQNWIDQYQGLREPGKALSTNSIFANIDRLASYVRAAQPREQARWGIVPRSGNVTAGGYTYNFGAGLGFQSEVNWKKDWYAARLDFADTNFLARPAFSVIPGPLAGPVTIVISPAVGLGDKPANSQVILTLDGTDPRLPGGTVRTGANVLSNTGPITITVSNTVRLFARSRNPVHVNLTGANNPPISSPWSGPMTGTYYFSNTIPPLRITEIMYHPPPPPAGNTNDADNFEYLEFKNIGATPLNVNRFRLRGGVEFDFPNIVLGAGQTCLVLADVGAFSSRYPTNGLIIAGAYTNNPDQNRLGNGGDHLKLEGGFREPILDFDYKDGWYPTTDGAGFSLQIVDENLPTSAWGLKTSWRPSGQPNGTPGAADPGAVNIATVYVNEIMTHTDPPLTDAIELYNPSAVNVDLSGWFLTDNFSNPKKYRIPNGTSVAANGYIVFYASNSFGAAFNLNSHGDSIYLFSGSANTNLTGYVHGFDFGAQANGATFGRYINSIGEEHFPTQTAPSLGAVNAGPKVGPIVISEIHYHPPDVPTVEGPHNDLRDEYIELENITGVPQPLFDPNFPTNAWRLRNAVDFTFPTNVTIPPGGHVVVVSFDPNEPYAAPRFRAANQVPDTTPLFGPFQGQLANSGNGVELARPDVPEPPNAIDANAVYYILVDKVSYQDQAPWPVPADGLGPSIQRVSPSGYGNDPSNWVAAVVTPGAAYAGGTPPNITAQPVSQSALLGGNTTFTVAADGSGPFSYKWRFSGNFISGATNASLVLTNVQASAGGDYQVIVLNSAGVVASSNATLTVILPVAILQQPSSQNVRLNDLVSPGPNVGLSVVASSVSPITYQWRFNDVNIPGATNSTLVLTGVTPSQTGDYKVVVNDAYSSATSSVAKIKIYSNFGWRFASITGNIGSSSNSVGTNVLIYMQTAGEAYVDDVSLVPLSGPTAGVNVLTNGDFEAPLSGGPWVIPATMPGSSITNTYAHSGSYSLHVVATNGGSIANSIKQVLPPINTNIFCTLSFWFRTLADSNTLNVRTFAGSALSMATNVQALDLGASIASQPKSVSVAYGGAASFSVVASGSEPFSYQWLKDGTNLANGGTISGATSAILTVSNAQDADAGSYSVKVSNALTSTNSASATLTLLAAPPVITLQPQSQQAPCHGSVTFTVAASGSQPLTYQWQFGQTAILNATNASLTLTDVSVANNGTYSVTVSNSLGSTNSAGASLAVTDSGSPNLSVQQNGTNVVISWPRSCTTYQLQETQTLSPPSWSPVTATAAQSQTQFTVTIPIANSKRFYRLSN